MHFLFFAFLISHIFCLDCYQGTNNDFSIVTCPNVDDSCISAFLSTGGLPSWNISEVDGMGTRVYACGNCGLYQFALNNTVVHSVSCCNSPLCNTITGPVPSVGCDSITSQALCTSDPGCYWCNGFLGNSFGVCKSLYYPRFLGPCFTQAVFSPPPICSEINCKPVVPAFSSNITLQELTTFGFPPVDPSLHAGLSFQLLAAEVRYLTPDVTNFCDVDAELQHWCGHSAEVFPNRFKYCIVAETWPIVDMQGWMQNTTFGATLGVNNVFYPYICLCHIPTSPFERPRAYFVPKNVYAVFDYSPNCGEEHAMLAMYLLFMLFALVVFILVLYDTFLLISLTLTQKRGNQIPTITDKLELGTKTIVVKVCMILYFLVTITCMAMFVSPEKEGSGQRYSVRILFKLFGLILLFLSFTVSVFTYVEIVLVSRIFGNHKGKKVMLKIFSYFFFFYHGILLLAVLGLLSAVTYYVQKLNGTLSVDGLAELVFSEGRLSPLSKALMVILLAVQTTLTIITAILVFYVCAVILRKAENLKKQRSIQAIFVRAVALVVAVIASLPCLGILAVQVYVFGWVSYGSTTYIWASEYRAVMATQWLFFALFATELIWVSAIAYSMSTVVKRSLMHQAIAAYMGFTIASSSTSGSGSSGSRSRSQRGTESIDSGAL